MCQQCLDAVRKHFPDCPDDDIHEFLFSATAYPAGGPDIVERQLAEHKEAGCKTWEEACCRSDELTTIAMHELHLRDAFDSAEALFPAVNT